MRLVRGPRRTVASISGLRYLAGIDTAALEAATRPSGSPTCPAGRSTSATRTSTDQAGPQPGRRRSHRRGRPPHRRGPQHRRAGQMRLSSHSRWRCMGGKLRGPSASWGVRPTRLTHASRPVRTPAGCPGDGSRPASAALWGAVAESQFCHDSSGESDRDTRPSQHQPARRRRHDTKRQPNAPVQVGVPLEPQTTWQPDHYGERQPAQHAAPAPRPSVTSSTPPQRSHIHRINTAPLAARVSKCL